MALKHHCRQHVVADRRDIVRAHIWALRELDVRLLLAATELDGPDSEEFLDAHVPECSACYRDLILELVAQFSAANQVEFGGREGAIKALHDELEIVLSLAAESESNPS